MPVSVDSNGDLTIQLSTSFPSVTITDASPDVVIGTEGLQGPMGNSVWGGIQGDPNNQTDIINLINARDPLGAADQAIAEHLDETDPHPQYIDAAELNAAIANHVSNDDSRLSDERIPIDGSASDAKLGDRTADDTEAPTSLNGSLTQWLGWIANRIKAITGKADWFADPSASLEDAANHIATQGNPHGTTAAQVGADAIGTAASAIMNFANTLGTAAYSSTLDFDPNGAAIAQVATHVGLTNPHPQYATTIQLTSAIASIPAAPVQSVFGRIGSVVPQSGDYNSDQITEGSTNLWYTNTRFDTRFDARTSVFGRSLANVADAAAARSAIGAVGGAAGSSGQLQFNSSGAFAGIGFSSVDSTNNQLTLSYASAGGSQKPQLILKAASGNIANDNLLELRDSAGACNTAFTYDGKLIIGGQFFPTGFLDVRVPGSSPVRSMAYGSTGSLAITRPEGTTGVIRVGAAYNKKGIYSDTDLNLTYNTNLLFYVESGGTSAQKASLSSSGDLALSSTTASTSTTNGAFVVAGGAGFGGAVNVGGQVQIDGTATATKIRINNLVGANATTSLDVGGTYIFNVSRTSDGLVAFRVSASGDLTAFNSLSTSGSLSAGNAALSKITFPNAWNVDKIIFRSDVLQKISVDASGNFNWVTAGKNFNFSDVGTFAIASTTASTSTTTGSFTTAGGAGIAGALNVGGNASVTGSISAGTAYNATRRWQIGEPSNNHPSIFVATGFAFGNGYDNGTATGICGRANAGTATTLANVDLVFGAKNALPALTINPGDIAGYSTTINGTVAIAGTLKLGSYTVATLPAAGTAGRIAYASDARWSGGIGCLVIDSGSTWLTPNGVQASETGYHRTISANRTLDRSDRNIWATTAGITITLPLISSAPFVPYRIRNLSAGDIAIAIAGTNTVEGGSTLTLAAGNAVDLENDGVSSWRIM